MIHDTRSRSLPRWIGVGLCVLVTFVGSRPAWPMGWERGIKLGINSATFAGDFGQVIGSEQRIGFVGGAFLTRRVSSRFGLESELLYAMKGSKDSFEATDQTGVLLGRGQDHWILKYIEVPVLARVSLAPSARLRPEVCLGPSFGFKLGGTFESKVPGYPTTSTEITRLKTLDVGVAAGLGVSIGRGPVNWLLDLRYTRGLSSAFESGIFDAINSAFTVMAGICY